MQEYAKICINMHQICKQICRSLPANHVAQSCPPIVPCRSLTANRAALDGAINAVAALDIMQD